MKKIYVPGNHRFGNFLNSPSGQPASQSSLAKRSSDSTITPPPKRQRNDNRPRTTEVVSVDGNSDTLEMDRSANSTVKRNTGPQGSHSLRSSETQHPNIAIDEYRSTSTHAGVRASKKRSRHPKKGQALGNGGQEQESDKASVHDAHAQPRFKTHGRRLISYANDRIEDEGEEVITTGALSGRANGRSNAPCATAVFAPISKASSDTDDELYNAVPPPPRTKMRDRMNEPTRSNVWRGPPTISGLKRAAESPDMLQDEQPAKRRHEPSSEANVPRTKFSTQAIGSARGRPDAFRVKKAVCEKSFIYPAADNMLEDANGASNVPCFMLPNEEDPDRFMVTDIDGAELKGLRWISPNLPRVRIIYIHRASPILKILSATGVDLSTNFLKGAATFIEFDSVQEAIRCADLCCRANNSISLRNTDCENLRLAMGETLKRIREWNMKQADMQIAARQADIGQCTDDDPGGDAHNDTDHAHTDGNLVYEEKDKERVKRYTRKPQESQRSLRSVKFKEPSPTPPPPERWTVKNPNWVDEYNYDIPLIYERTTISATDIERLDEGQFLNDEIISFYAKYLHKELESRDEQMAKKVYVFSSFFWEKLRLSGYDGVKSWTTKVDMSSFDYIVVPINQSAHWYLAIICNPGGLLPEENARQDGDGAETAPSGPENQVEVFPEGQAGTKLETVTTSLAQISFDEERLDGVTPTDPEEPKATSIAKKSKSARRGPGPRKYHPKDPRVIVLDSLDGAHTNVATTLKNYLKNEIRERKNVDIEVPQQFGMAAKDIPFQTNFTDCGVYLLGYLEEFMKDPHEFTKKILQHESRTWDVDASAMRNQIRGLILDLQSKYRKGLRRQKREKRLASKPKKANSQTPPAATQPSSPRFTSEQQKSSSTGSAVAHPPQRSHAGVTDSPTRQIETDRILDQGSASGPPSPSQKKQAGPKQAVVVTRQVMSSSESVKSGLQAVEPMGKMVGKPNQSKESKESAPPQQEQTSSCRNMTKVIPESETSSSSESGSEALNANDSMIVHPDRSMELQEARPSKRERNISRHVLARPGRMIGSSSSSTSRPRNANIGGTTGQRIKSMEVQGTQSAAEQHASLGPPNRRDSVEVIEQPEPKQPSSFEPPMARETPEILEPSTVQDGDYDQRFFLRPITSSPPPSVRPIPSSATSKTASKGRSDSSGASSINSTTKLVTPRQKRERSRFWPSTTKASPRQDESSRPRVAPSSSIDRENVARGKATSKEEGKRGKEAHGGRSVMSQVKSQDSDKRSSPSPTIDLTND